MESCLIFAPEEGGVVHLSDLGALEDGGVVHAEEVVEVGDVVEGLVQHRRVILPHEQTELS